MITVPGRDWRLLAPCRHADPELFFPVSASGPSLDQVTHAKVICAGRPVRRQCLPFALDTRQDYGVWGRHERARAPPTGKESTYQDLTPPRSAATRIAPPGPPARPHYRNSRHSSKRRRGVEVVRDPYTFLRNSSDSAFLGSGRGKASWADDACRNSEISARSPRTASPARPAGSRWTPGISSGG